MSLRSFAVRSLAALAVAVVTEHVSCAQDNSVYTPTYVAAPPRAPHAALDVPNPITPLFRAILPVQAVAPVPTPIGPPTAVAPTTRPAPTQWVAPNPMPAQATTQVMPVQGAPMGPAIRQSEPLEEAADYVMGTLQMGWDDSAYRTFEWVNLDYQLSWLRGAHTPPLLTASGSAVPLAQAGVFGLNSTATLVGKDTIQASPSSGFRLDGGQYLDTWFAVEARVFVLEDRASIFHAGGTGAADSFSVARPFIDTATGAESAAVTAFPGAFAGSVDVASRAQLWGTEMNAVFREEPGRFFQTKLRAGVRYLDLDQTVSITELSTPQNAFAIPFNGAVVVTNPDSVRVIDTFRTRNQFIGPQVGFETGWKVGRLNFDLDARVAIGGNHQVVDIGGTSETITGGRTTNLVQGGLLATSSNIGEYSRDTLSIVPEAELKAEYRFNPTVSAFVSYDILAWSDAVNPGEQIPLRVDLTRVPTSAVFGQPGGTNPGVSITHTHFTSQSLHVGVTLKF